MANAAGGRYHANSTQPPQSQYSSFGSGGGQYYSQAQQHQPNQQMGYQYYGHQQSNPFQQQQSAMGYTRPPAPPPPPPPPGEPVSSVTSTTNSANQAPVYGAPLLPPPLPPMFPWMSPLLVESMRSSRFGKTFEEEASNLPFVPIIVNDADLAKMTENVVKEAEEINSQSLQYYKDVMKLDLPKSLKDMFQPLYCKLCILSLSSPVVAKDHYNGKRHKKAVDAWKMSNKPQYSPNDNHSNESVQAPSNTVSKPTGLINGFITKHQIQIKNNVVSVPAPLPKPPPPPLLQTNVQRETPPISPQINIKQQEQSANKFSKPVAPSPPASQSSNNKSDLRAGGGPPYNSQQNQNSWKRGNESGNRNQADFSQAKRPRQDDPPPKSANLGICQICNVQLSSQVMAEQHFKGKNHAAKLAALEEQGGKVSGTPGVLRIDLNAGGNSNQTSQRLPGAAAPSGNLNINKPFNKGSQKPAFQRGGGVGGRGGGGRGGSGPPHFNQNRGNNNNSRGGGINKNNRFNDKRGKWS